jgi:YaiO family outer membrane protein
MTAPLRLVLATALVSGLQAAIPPAAPGLERAEARAGIEEEDVLKTARDLATSGHRAESLDLLQRHLTSHPRDTDAQTLFGIILSWEGRYDEARQQLQEVLDRSPDNGDALSALINVELWSDHPSVAEALSRRAMAANEETASLLLSRARALSAMNRLSDARAEVKRALAIAPGNEQAQRLSRGLENRSRQWRAGTVFGTDFFSDDRDAWRESQLSIAREGTPAGSLIMRVSHANRFSSTDNQFEVEAYPRLRRGTYAFVGVGVAPAAQLYPEYRVAGDLYQSLGRGFEGSVGYRRLGFDTPVDIYVATLSKYAGPWLLSGRTFVVPDQTEGSHSFHGSVRRYFGDGETYVGARYGRGFAREELHTVNDFASLDSDTFAGEANVVISRRLTLSGWASRSRDERAFASTLTQYSIGGGLWVRF